ncbi:hypothetical protein [Polaribacter sp. NJDZ03]|uniref:hypothetical protein n=1 Tax=Polaribacter sp. NJDZ03 TaxID=2855841 RepID=UPI001C49DAE0|nr:hypothetical protein [Polaribacter sp. NJDZ03]
MNIIIKTTIIIDAILSLTIFGFIFIFYYKAIGYHAFELNSKWNKRLEKPRLFLIASLLLLFSALIHTKYGLEKSEYNTTIFFILTFFIYFISVFIFLCFNDKRLKKFIFRQQVKQLENFGTKNKKDVITKKEVDKIYKKLNHKYFKCSLESFNSFINSKALFSEKIIWLDATGKKRNKDKTGSLTTLIEFISVAQKISPEDENYKQNIEYIINYYFKKNESESFLLQENSIYRWKGNNEDYLIELRQKFDSIISSTTL